MPEIETAPKCRDVTSFPFDLHVDETAKAIGNNRGKGTGRGEENCKGNREQQRQRHRQRRRKLQRQQI
jgi:hypothetical protein